VEEGRRAAKWLVAYSPVKELAAKGDVNIVELQGTVGSAPAIDRKVGFEEVLKSYPNFKITRSQTGDFTRAKGKEVMEAFLKAGKSLPKRIVTEEGVFPQEVAAREFPKRQY